jgi:hypothetical protein
VRRLCGLWLGLSGWVGRLIEEEREGRDAVKEGCDCLRMAKRLTVQHFDVRHCFTVTWDIAWQRLSVLDCRYLLKDRTT